MTRALEEDGRGVALHRDKCIVCMEGPQFSTRAESVMYRAWGGDLINMSVLPEAKLAREAEIGCVTYIFRDGSIEKLRLVEWFRGVAGMR